MSFPHRGRSCRTEPAYSFNSNHQHSRSSALTSVVSFLLGSSEHCSVRHSCLRWGMSPEWLLRGAGPQPDPSMGSFLDGNVLILLFLCWDDVFKLTETWSVMGQPAEHTPENLAQSRCFLLAGWWLLFLINEMFSLLWLMSHSHLNHSQTSGVLCEIWTVKIRQRLDFLGKLGARCVQDIFLLSCVLAPGSTL